jgi:hypothetical protein
MRAEKFLTITRSRKDFAKSLASITSLPEISASLASSLNPVKAPRWRRAARIAARPSRRFWLRLGRAVTP